MTSTARRFRVSLSAWYAIGVLWLAHVALMAGMMLFRAITHAGVATSIQFDDVPPLRYLSLNYDILYWAAVGSGAVVFAVWVLLCQQSFGLTFPSRLGGSRKWNREQTETAVCSLFAVLFTIFGLVACRYGEPQSEAAFEVPPTSILDWLSIVSLAVTTWLLPATIRQSSEADPRPADEFPLVELPAAARSSRIVRTGMAYLLGCAAFFTYAWREHEKFWGAEGGTDYTRFFLEEELPQARLVLYSTSVLFASLAAIGGCIMLHLIRRTIHADAPNALMKPQGEASKLAFLLAGAWAATTMIPWQIKILPEIRAEDGWIFPVVTLLFTVAGLAPMIYVSLLMMLHDFRKLGTDADLHETGVRVYIPRRTEFALLSFVLFPVYPLLRGFRWINSGVIYASLLIAGIPIAAGWGRHFVASGQAFTLDGLHGMFESSPFPVFIFSISTLAAAAAYQLRPHHPSGGSLHTAMLAVGAAAVGGLTWFVNKADTLFTFDDWRGMLRSAQFPVMRVIFSLLAAYFVYIVLRRLLMHTLEFGGRLLPPREPGKTGVVTIVARPVVALAAVASLGLATWPFWGWQNVSKNVFARTIEFNHRHEFELRFLHWMFDLDRDGYSSVLHGADPDDSDPGIQAGGVDAPTDDNPVPISEFAIADAEKAHRFPNVVVFFLEGVVPRSISAYGQRQLIGTPHIDAIAKEGTVFTQARCHYPSTWDGWFAICSGRYLRIKEMDTSVGFGNRYTRYNNLYKLLRLAGVRRWCHADTAPFYDMLVPHSLRGRKETAWEPKFDSSVDSEEEELGIKRGDKRAKRMVDFIDSLEQGEKFFICEHMSDTHFPWRKTPIEHAKKLGFPDGLEKYGNDAILPSGGRDERYSRYFQTITRMDGQIGQVVDKLKEKGLYDNTMIVVVSDHGCQWWEHEHMYYVSHLYDPALRIPLIIRMPGIDGGGKHVGEPVMQTDIMPTVMELAGLKLTNPSDEYPFTCKSLVPLMTGTATEAQRREYWNRDVILTTHYDKHGVLSRFQHKLIFDRPTGTYRLFDLKSDPGETRNLADDEPELLEAMMEKFRGLMRNHGAIIGGIKKSDDPVMPKPIK